MKSKKAENRKARKAVYNSNSPIYNTKISEYDVVCPHCERKEVLKTTLYGTVKKTCRRCNKTYKVDTTKLRSRDFEKFSYWIDTGWS